MNKIKIISGTIQGTGARIFLDEKEIEGVTSISYNVSVDDMIPKVSLEMYADSIELTTKAEVSINKKKVNDNKKFTRFEIMDI